MSGYVHQLPTNAQASGADTIDHVRLERVIRDPGSLYHREVRYGTLNTEGEFVEDAMLDGTRKLVIPDIAAFNEELSENSSAPDTRGNSASHLDKDVAAHADNQDLWHSINW